MGLCKDLKPIIIISVVFCSTQILKCLFFKNNISIFDARI